MPQIQLENITKYYRHEKRLIPAVKDINLVIEPRDFVFVTGSSGAGKSTLLQLIASEITPDEGRIYFDHIEYNAKRSFLRKPKKDGIGYVPQLSHLMRKRTISENLMMVARMRTGFRKERPHERIEKALRMVGLPDAGRFYPVELSQGECRRVELARAILNRPSVLILDELTANLDEDTIWDLFHLISEINRMGTTVIMATHAKNFVNIMRKRVITLVAGEIFGDVQKGRYGDVVKQQPPL